MLTMVFWDVQHGHALYVKTATRHIVFDLGRGSYKRSDKEFSPLSHIKNKYGVKQLDAVVITHPHSDHLDDIVNFNDLNPKVLVHPKHLEEEEIRKGNATTDKQCIDEYLDINKRYVYPVYDDPFNPANNGGVTFQVFRPTKSSQSNLNNHSIVTVISCGSFKALIPGDNENPSWNELLDDDTFRAAIKNTSILLAPHHGRESGYSEALFEHISPYLTIISDGPETDTSARDRYSRKSKGWRVYSRNGESKERKCLTTRNDGVIIVESWLDYNGTTFLGVTID
jgi:beta-lactamase superfamily II metal-dependent hydrolase